MIRHINLGQLRVVPLPTEPRTVALKQGEFNDPVDFPVHFGKILGLNGAQGALPEINYAPHFGGRGTSVFPFFQPLACAHTELLLHLQRGD